MNISAPFINRPVGTSLLTIALALAGCLGFLLLPVSPLPQVDFPTIQVSAGVARSQPADDGFSGRHSLGAPVRTHRRGHANDLDQQSRLDQHHAQFELNRDINGAARDVQAAINAARSQLRRTCPANPTYRKVNPADAPVLILSLTSDTHRDQQNV